jgi:hypothetical protein
MARRDSGYYWVTWSNWADEESIARRPAPLLGLWDGEVWWFTCLDRYHFDVELIAISERIRPPAAVLADAMAMAS